MFGAPNVSAQALTGIHLFAETLALTPRSRIFVVFDIRCAADALNGQLGCVVDRDTNSIRGPTTACFRAAYYTPTFFKYNNSLVSGTQWINYENMVSCTSRSSFASSSMECEATGSPAMLVAVTILRQMQQQVPPGTWAWDGSWFGTPGYD